MPTTTCDHLVHPEHWPGDAGGLTDAFDLVPDLAALTAVLAAYGFINAWETQ